MSTVVVHAPINVNGVEFGRGDVIRGSLADDVLANQVWASSVTPVPDEAIPAADEPAPAPSVAPAPAPAVRPAPVAAPVAPPAPPAASS
jgi:hypothetical protein